MGTSLHHFAIEIPKVKEPLEREFWNILGFGRHPNRTMPPRPSIDTWYFNRESGQAVMVYIREEPIIPDIGHIGLIVPDLVRTVRILASFKHDTGYGKPYCGHKRAWTSSPSGHLVEMMDGVPSVKMGPPPNG